MFNHPKFKKKQRVIFQKEEHTVFSIEYFKGNNVYLLEDSSGKAIGPVTEQEVLALTQPTVPAEIYITDN